LLPTARGRFPSGTWGQGLLQLLGLLLVGDDQGVQVPAAAHLELHIVLVLLDLDRCGTKGQLRGDPTPPPPTPQRTTAAKENPNSVIFSTLPSLTAVVPQAPRSQQLRVEAVWLRSSSLRPAVSKSPRAASFQRSVTVHTGLVVHPRRLLQPSAALELATRLPNAAASAPNPLHVPPRLFSPSSSLRAVVSPSPSPPLGVTGAAAKRGAG